MFISLFTLFFLLKKSLQRSIELVYTVLQDKKTEYGVKVLELTYTLSTLTELPTPKLASYVCSKIRNFFLAAKVAARDSVICGVCQSGPKFSHLS